MLNVTSFNTPGNLCSYALLTHVAIPYPGGNGGRGGDVILECSPAVWDLSGLQHHINKKRDGNGPSKNMIGSRGADKPFVSFLVLVINIINLLQYWNFHLDRSMEENISVQWICENLFGKLCMEHYFFRSLAHLHIS
nr:uncharacterized protein LOC104086824 isoform X2 [Nicotiana tomentosiformis]